LVIVIPYEKIDCRAAPIHDVVKRSGKLYPQRT
jgi:hypothetical protein